MLLTDLLRASKEVLSEATLEDGWFWFRLEPLIIKPMGQLSFRRAASRPVISTLHRIALQRRRDEENLACPEPGQ